MFLASNSIMFFWSGNLFVQSSRIYFMVEFESGFCAAKVGLLS